MYTPADPEKQRPASDNAGAGTWQFLSYPMGADSPAFGGEKGATITPMKQMASGDSCNTSHWSFPNHLGTHLDFPRHFMRHGRTVDDYGADFFVFKRAAVLDLGEVGSGEIVSFRHLDGHSLPEDIEILMIKTGFCMKREHPAYWQNNPGFSPELADFLRDGFSNLKVFGFDSISLTSYAHRELGRKAHRRFLEEPRSLLLLEDMDLTGIAGDTRFVCVVVAPWVVRGADAVPCTVMAKAPKRMIVDEA